VPLIFFFVFVFFSNYDLLFSGPYWGLYAMSTMDHGNRPYVDIGEVHVCGPFTFVHKCPYLAMTMRGHLQSPRVYISFQQGLTL
jgi:hypothetical protein